MVIRVNNHFSEAPESTVITVQILVVCNVNWSLKDSVTFARKYHALEVYSSKL